MSIESKIDDLIAALNANTAALTGGAKASTTSEAKAEKAEKPKATKEKAADKPKSKYTKAEMQAAVNEVKEQKGTKVAKDLIKDAGFDKLADVTDDKIDELYLAAKAALGEGEESGDDGL